MTKTGWQAIGEIAQARRQRLGLNQDELAQYGGPRVSTVGKFERGAQESFPLRTQQQIEKALGWERGTIEDFVAAYDNDNESDESAQSLEAWQNDLIFEDVPDLNPPDRTNLVRMTTEQNRQVADLRNQLVHRRRVDFVFDAETPDEQLVERMENLTAQLVHIENLLYPLQLDRVLVQSELGRIASEVNRRRLKPEITLFGGGSVGAVDLDLPLDLGNQEAVERWLSEGSGVDEREAARDTGRSSRGQARRATSDTAGEPEVDDPTDVEPR